jgi:hypothetical protein
MQQKMNLEYKRKTKELSIPNNPATEGQVYENSFSAQQPQHKSPADL